MITKYCRTVGVGRGRTPVIQSALLRSETTSLAAHPSRPGTVGGIFRVLVVDDNMDAAESLAALLEHWGYKVEVATHADAALARWHMFKPGAVLLDIGLPGVNGHELARRLRKLPGGCEVLLVAITGYGQAPDHQLSQQAGIDEHMTKPVHLDALQTVLSTRLQAGDKRA